MSPDASRSAGCLPTAVTLIAVGFCISTIGWLWKYPQLTYTPGVIVESQMLRPPRVTRITYEYTAFGVRHRGERTMSLSTQFRPFYQVGELFPVYFVTAHPEKSYGPNRPVIQPMIWLGIYLAAFGGTVIYFARPR